jgi:hypothetical protein
MKFATFTRTLTGADMRRWVEALSTPWASFLSTARPMFRRVLQRRKHRQQDSSAHQAARRSNSPPVMLVESDVSKDSHDFLP